jgi:hypothetical protein
VTAVALLRADKTNNAPVAFKRPSTGEGSGAVPSSPLFAAPVDDLTNIRRAAFLLVSLEVDEWEQERNAAFTVLPPRVAVACAKPAMRCQAH